MISTEPDAELLTAHEQCHSHRAALAATAQASCFFCCQTFDTRLIEEWWDHGQTAVCPLCGIDAVLPGVHSEPFLDRMYVYWFGTPCQPPEANHHD
jgi:hypothetical protein